MSAFYIPIAQNAATPSIDMHTTFPPPAIPTAAIYHFNLAIKHVLTANGWPPGKDDYSRWYQDIITRMIEQDPNCP